LFMEGDLCQGPAWLRWSIVGSFFVLIAFDEFSLPLSFFLGGLCFLLSVFFFNCFIFL
jgi:hypothetical protein